MALFRGRLRAMLVEPALDAAPVARHRKAAGEEHHRRERVALLGKAEPGRVLERLVGGAEQVDEADAGDERGVLEQVDDVVDDAGDDMAQRLRERNEGLHLPPGKTKRIGGLLLT